MCSVCRRWGSCCGASPGLTSSTLSMAWSMARPPPPSSLSPRCWWGSPWSVRGPGRWWGCGRGPEGPAERAGHLTVGRGWGGPRTVWPCGVGRARQVQMHVRSGPALLTLCTAAGHSADPARAAAGGTVLRSSHRLLVPVCGLCHCPLPLQDPFSRGKGKGTEGRLPGAALSRGWPRGSRSPLGPQLPLPCSQDLPCCSVPSTCPLLAVSVLGS